jgi:hypothetical protein
LRKKGKMTGHASGTVNSNEMPESDVSILLFYLAFVTLIYTFSLPHTHMQSVSNVRNCKQQQLTYVHVTMLYYFALLGITQVVKKKVRMWNARCRLLQCVKNA